MIYAYETGRAGVKMLKEMFPETWYFYTRIGMIYLIETRVQEVKDFMNAHPYSRNPKCYFKKI